jgi:hypothetical protein
MRRDFVANVSHELRTPLTVISGFIEHMHDDPDPDPAEWRQQMNMVNDQARRMLRLVDDLLTLSRLEDQEQSPAEEELDMRDLVSRPPERGAATFRPVVIRSVARRRPAFSGVAVRTCAAPSPTLSATPCATRQRADASCCAGCFATARVYSASRTVVSASPRSTCHAWPSAFTVWTADARAPRVALVWGLPSSSTVCCATRPLWKLRPFSAQAACSARCSRPGASRVRQARCFPDGAYCQASPFLPDSCLGRVNTDRVPADGAAAVRLGVSGGRRTPREFL